MKKYIAAALTLANVVLMTAPAFAQQDAAPSAMDIEMERRKKANAEADQGYKVMMKQTAPTKEVKSDPWGNARAPSPEKEKK